MTEPTAKAQLARELLEKAVSEWRKSSAGREGLDFFMSGIGGDLGRGIPGVRPYGPHCVRDVVVEGCQLCDSNGWRRSVTPEHPNGTMKWCSHDPAAEARYGKA
jgi:hypothetical protein